VSVNNLLVDEKDMLIPQLICFLSPTQKISYPLLCILPVEGVWSLELLDIVLWIIIVFKVHIGPKVPVQISAKGSSWNSPGIWLGWT
jgi:hypothetical protein